MGNQVANLNLTQVNEPKIIENRVYRKILGSAHGTIQEIMRGDIGALLLENRIME